MSAGSYVLDAVKNFSFVFMALFPIINPIGCAPIFLTLASRYPEDVRNFLARKIAIYAFAIIICSFLIGNLILAFFGISLFVLRIAGGIVVAAAGWSLLNQKDTPRGEGHRDLGSLEDALSHAFYPLTLPITVGPGCISVAITLGARIKKGDEAIWERGYVASALAMVLVCYLVFLCYRYADRLVPPGGIGYFDPDPHLRIHPACNWSSDYLGWPEGWFACSASWRSHSMTSLRE